VTPLIPSDEAIPLQDAINQLLRPLIGDFMAETAAIVDNGSNRTDVYSTIVHNDGNSSRDTGVRVDNVAAVVDCYEILTTEALHAAYQRIGAVKSLQRTDRPAPQDGDVHMTTSIIVARDSGLTLEDIASEMSRLNATVPSHRWPDMVAVLSKGVVNYTALVPGSERNGDFLLPAEEISARSPAPSVFVQMTIRATAALTLNKVASLIMCRIAIFQPGIRIPNYQDLIKDIPRHGAVTATYQFNLANVLVEMTNDQIIASRLPRESFNIVSGKQLLGSVQFQPWQDGGVFVVRGKFPLDLFLVFLNEIVPGLSPTDMQYFRGSGVQVSYVLPINMRQFLQTLSIFQQRSSNISIQRETSKIVMEKIGDEGTTSPFVARLMLSIYRLRSAIYYEKSAQDRFDGMYEPVLSGLRSARESSKEISTRWESHRARVESGAVVTINGRAVQIGENINNALKRDLESFLNAAVRTIKHSMQALADHLDLDIGFLFQKGPSFQTGVARVRASDPVFADYLVGTRLWSEPLLLIRNDLLEHGTMPSPKVSYIVDNPPVRAEEPMFQGSASLSLQTTHLTGSCVSSRK
jgi:hypothetical protein